MDLSPEFKRGIRTAAAERNINVSARQFQGELCDDIGKSQVRITSSRLAQNGKTYKDRCISARVGRKPLN